MRVEVCDVKGDGNCYYRCVWNVVRHSVRLRCALGLEDCRSERDAVGILRHKVAAELRHNQNAQAHLKEIWELSQTVDDLDEEYPIVEVIKSFSKFNDKVILIAANHVATTNIMASALEHTIIQTMIPTLHIAIVSTTRKQSITYWMKQLAKQLQIFYKKKYIAILLNVNNIHYKYVKINGSSVATKEEVEKFVFQHSRGKQ